MSRKRHRLVPEAFGQKRWREGGDVEADPLRGESGNYGNPGARLKTPSWEQASPLVTLYVGTTAPPESYPRFSPPPFTSQ